jgi:hypothetical protein
MKQFYAHIVIFLILIVSIIPHANAQLSINANYRNRFEVRDGYGHLKNEIDVASAFMHQRTRIGFIYKSENLKLNITPQDVRIWGDETISTSTGVFGDKASLSMYEGFAEIKFGQDNWVSVGRQELKYDSERLFSIRNWNFYGIVYDALVLKLNYPDLNIHFGSSWNSTGAANNNNFYPSNRIKSINYAWANRKVTDKLNVSFMHISSGVTQTDTTNHLNFKHTTGFYSTYNTKNLQIWGNAYYQYGKNQTGKNVNAFLVDADAGYKLGNLNPGIGLSYLSGNSKTGAAQTTDQLFDLLYGARHKFFGFIDYFSNIPSSTKQGGLTDMYCYLKFNVSEKISINNTGHYFMLSQLNDLTPGNKNLGYENDLIVRYKFYGWGTLDLGYLVFAPTNSLKEMHGVSGNNLSQFIYLQLVLSPKLF